MPDPWGNLQIIQFLEGFRFPADVEDQIYAAWTYDVRQNRVQAFNEGSWYATDALEGKDNTL